MISSLIQKSQLCRQLCGEIKQEVVPFLRKKLRKEIDLYRENKSWYLHDKYNRAILKTTIAGTIIGSIAGPYILGKNDPMDKKVPFTKLATRTICRSIVGSAAGFIGSTVVGFGLPFIIIGTAFSLPIQVYRYRSKKKLKLS